MYFTATYKLDVSKVKSIDDILIVLNELSICVDRPSEDFKKLCNLISKETGEVIKTN